MLTPITTRTRAEIGTTGAALAARAIAQAHAEGREATVLLAAAPSQLPVLEALVREDVHHRPVRYFHMDEYVGLAPDAPQAFGAWLERHYLDRLPRGHRATFHRMSTSGDPEEAAATYAALLPDDAFDLVLCGIGINGHLAFNDPGCDLDDPLPVRHIQLATASREQQVDEGLFPSLADVPEYAVTVTVPRLLAARAVVCSVLGEAKAEAMKAMLEQPVSSALPATALRGHPAVTVLADEGALRDVSVSLGSTTTMG